MTQLKLIIFFWNKFTSYKEIKTKCFLIKKREAVKTINDIRLICINESFWKMIEVVMQPISFLCNRTAIDFIPGIFGFTPGGETFKAWSNKFDRYGHKKLEGKDSPNLQIDMNDKGGHLRYDNIVENSPKEEELDDYLSLLREQMKQKQENKNYNPLDFLLK